MKLLKENGNKIVEFSRGEVDVLEEALKILLPFAKVTDVLQDRKMIQALDELIGDINRAKGRLKVV